MHTFLRNSTFLFALSVFSLGNAVEAFAQCETYFNNLVINEFMAANSSTAADEFGEFDDWVEIYNSSNEAINMNGYFLSDSRSDRTKYVFPDVTLESDDYLIIWCDNQPDQGLFHTEFALSADGEVIGLYNPDTNAVDLARFKSIPSNISMGRFPNGSGPFKILIPTFNAPNINSVDVGIVINEYQAINQTTADDQWGGFEDWIEFYNNSSQPINLGGYFLSDEFGNPTSFEFPDTVMQPGGYLIVWCDMGLMEPGLHTFFFLGGDGDDIIFSNPDTVTIDYVRFEQQISDDSEGRYPNGTGPFVCMAPTWQANNGPFLGLHDAVDPSGKLKIWPNPAQGSTRIAWNDSESAILRLFDLQGREAANYQLRNGEQEIDINGMDAGIYILQVNNFSGKLIIY